MTGAPAGGENLPTCLIRSRSTAMTTFGSSWLDVPSNSAPQPMYTGADGGGGMSFTGRGALSVSSAMFWASANPDNSANKQSGMGSRFSMPATPERNCAAKQPDIINCQALHLGVEQAIQACIRGIQSLGF